MQSTLKKACVLVAIHAAGSNGITLKRASLQLYGTAGRDTDYPNNNYLDVGVDILNLIAKKVTENKRRNFLQQLEKTQSTAPVKSIVRDSRNLLECPFWYEDRILRAFEHLFYILELVNEKMSNDHDESKLNKLVDNIKMELVKEIGIEFFVDKSKPPSEAYLNQLFSAAGIQNVLQQLKKRIGEKIAKKRVNAGNREVERLELAKERSELLLQHFKDQESGAALRAFFDDVTAKVKVSQGRGEH